MSGHTDRDVYVDLEMRLIEDPADRSTRETTAAGSSYRDRFGRILTAFDERTWWDAVNDRLDEDGDFAARVAAKAPAEGVESRQRAIVEVMVDLVLEMEEIEVHKGLVYVLDELESYSLELMAIELLKRGADPNKEKGYSGFTPLHLAITVEKLDLVKMLLEKGAHLETKNDYGYTPFLKAVEHGAPEEIIDLLLEYCADVHAVTEDRKTALHFAAQKDDDVIVRKGMGKTMKKLIKKGLSVTAADKDGWTPLHEAAYHGREGAAGVLIEEGASVNARDHRRQTPLHVAAEVEENTLIKFLLDKKADATITDVDRNTPLDVAAEKQKKEAVNLLQNHPASAKKDNALKEIIERAMSDTDIKDGLIAQKITEMSRSGVISMLKPTKCGGEGKFQFLKDFATNPKLKKSTIAILDQFVLGKTRGRVICEIIDADMNAVPPDHKDFDHFTQSLLDVIVENNDKELAQHPAIRSMLDYKWEKFAKWTSIISLLMYVGQMLFFGLALLIAARPDLDNPGCYRDGWDYFRGVCEGISMYFFLSKLVGVSLVLFRLFKHRFNCQKIQMFHTKNYLLTYLCTQLPATILPFLIIPFRAATTWCASTGDGYCVDPTLLPNAANATNFTLDINQACITASNVQWIIASLAYMVNAILVFELLALFRITDVYVRVLKGIVEKEMLKFILIFIVTLYIFVGSFYLALRAGVAINMSTGAITSDLEVFRLHTLYPWHVAFAGIRILVESGGILDGDYFANDANEQYAGFQWFSIVMYLLFLFAVLVVLLNLLIAQMSYTYEKLQVDFDGIFIISRARTISALQKLGTPGLPDYKIKSCWQRYYEPEIEMKLPAEELKQVHEAAKAKEKDVLMELKNDWLKENSAEIARRLEKREGLALDYKRMMEQKVDQVAEQLTKRHLEREESAQQIKSLMEQKVDQMAAELTKRQLEREDSAQQIKNLMEQKVDQMAAELTKRQLEREDTALQYKRLLEQKVDHLAKVTDELTKRQLERENTALQYRSLLEQKVDLLTEMTAELTRRLQGGDENGPA